MWIRGTSIFLPQTLVFLVLFAIYRLRNNPQKKVNVSTIVLCIEKLYPTMKFNY